MKTLLLFERLRIVRRHEQAAWILKCSYLKISWFSSSLKWISHHESSWFIPVNWLTVRSLLHVLCHRDSSLLITNLRNNFRLQQQNFQKVVLFIFACWFEVQKGPLNPGRSVCNISNAIACHTPDHTVTYPNWWRGGDNIIKGAPTANKNSGYIEMHNPRGR